MPKARWKIGDRVGFDSGDEYVYGVIRLVTERLDADTLYSVKWDDGFEDDEGNIFPEWELDDPEDSDA